MSVFNVIIRYVGKIAQKYYYILLLQAIILKKTCQFSSFAVKKCEWHLGKEEIKEEKEKKE